MFSSSNSYLGGTGSGRPGPQQYMQPAQAQPTGFQLPPQAQQQQQQQQQQPNVTGIGPQFTGYGAPQDLQPQFTAYGAPAMQPGLPPPQQQLQLQQPPQLSQQVTGYPLQGSQSVPPQLAPLDQFQSGQQQLPQATPQQTGQTSAQMAQSFQSTSSAPSQPTRAPRGGTKIPNIRLSFITVQDQAKFEQLFKSAVGESHALSGDKARDLLLRSKLPGDSLSQIWTLADTTKSGQLLFPEFALAMYLCNLKLVGKDLPASLPERIRNEVSSMVDIISFAIPDDAPAPIPRSNAPSFDPPLRQNATSPPAPQQPQPQQPSSSQLLSQLTAQPTAFQPQMTGFQPQPTGFQAQPTGFQSQPGYQPPSIGYQPQASASMPQLTGFLQQPTGAQLSNLSVTGYSGPRPPMPPMPTGMGSTLSPGGTGALPLNAQPTGRPGQWGLVNTPATGLPNIDALQQRMMPQQGREGGFTTAGLAGNATIPWAVTKDEKKTYDQLFRAWDGFNKGFISGDVAIEIFGQSGLEKADLERVWALADHGNKGRLDLDEFAVAMHLIYRKLNNYPLPNQLPAELIPPSTRNFTDSIGTVKSLLSQDAESRKNSGATLLPQRTGVSYLKNHSFRAGAGPQAGTRKDATVFKNNDDDIGYRSSARRRLGAGGDRSPSPAQSASPPSERVDEEISIEQLRKKVREKQVLLDAMDFKDENRVDEDDALDRRDRRDAEELYRRIRRVQEDIDSNPNASLRNIDSGAERRALKRQLQALTDRLPELASQVRKTERNIADAKLELFRLKDARAFPGSASTVVGTGPGGTVTESDRLKARAKAMMQQRSAALTGKPAPTNGDDSLAAPKRLEEENSRIRLEKENNERMVRDVEESVREFGKGLEDSLKDGGEDSTSEHERRRWEDGLGVEDDVREFIFDLQRSSRNAQARRNDNNRTPRGDDSSSVRGRNGTATDGPSTSRDVSSSSNTTGSTLTAATPSTGSSSYSSYKTAEERAAFIKQQAEQKMAERLAALGIRAPARSTETVQQRQERDAKERQDRLRQAEEEDAKREQERQKRLADEQIQPPSSTPTKPSAKKPPPPPSRKGGKNEAVEKEETRNRAESDARKSAQEAEAASLRAEQESQEAQRKDIEDEARRQEDELAKEREAAQQRLKALEEQVKQGKVKKEEEKRRKQAVQREAKEKEARLSAQRVELEKARERERQLQLQLETLEDEDSSDDDEPAIATPTEPVRTVTEEYAAPLASRSSPPSAPTPASPRAPSTTQSSSPKVTSPPPGAATTSSDSNTKNPFLKRLAQSNESPAPAPPANAPTPTPNAEVSTNPFHRLTQENNASKSLPPAEIGDAAGRPSRVRPEEDEWSVVDSDNSSDDEEDQPSSGRNAAHLATIFFGTMGPPRPLSATGNGKTSELNSPAQAFPGDATHSPPAFSPASPGGASSILQPPAAPPMPPPMPPPLPGTAAGAMPGAPPPPPPPPPMAPGAPPPALGGGRGALLGEIASGRALKKVQTKDRSESSVAGRVLG